MLNANGWLAWLVELSPAIAWAVFVFGLGDDCCFSCDENCCEGDDIPDQVEVTVPDVANGLSPEGLPGNSENYFSSQCDACESIAGVYVLDRTDTGDDDNNYSWQYTEADFCEVVSTRYFEFGDDLSCTYPLTLDIQINTSCDVLSHGLCGMQCSVSLVAQASTTGEAYCSNPLATWHQILQGTFAWSWSTSSNWGPVDCTTATWNLPTETWGTPTGYQFCEVVSGTSSEIDVEAVVPP